MEINLEATIKTLPALRPLSHAVICNFFSSLIQVDTRMGLAIENE